VDEIKSDLEDIKDKIDYVTISLKPGIKEEVEISVGAEYLGTGAKHIITISLQDISYSELKEDLEKIAGNRINRLSDIPPKLANTIKAYLLRHGKENILEKLA
jgi:actin-like ATPase involved in cell morphogenesis